MRILTYNECRDRVHAIDNRSTLSDIASNTFADAFAVAFLDRGLAVTHDHQVDALVRSVDLTPRTFILLVLHSAAPIRGSRDDGIVRSLLIGSSLLDDLGSIKARSIQTTNL